MANGWMRQDLECVTRRTMAENQEAQSDTSFGDLVRAYRRAAGWTQEELAERTGLSVRGISNIEGPARHTPRRDTVQLLANALGIEGEVREDFLKVARPAQRDLESHTQSVGNLPRPATSFVGRRKEIAALDERLRSAATRLLTLTGPGGSGKTRLSIEVARGLHDEFVDGVVFVSLAPLRDPGLVPAAISAALGIGEQEGENPVDKLVRYLREKRTLLLLDNFEHLLDASHVLGSLVQSCPSLCLLVTSRGILHLSSEHVFEVPPLAMPDSALLSEIGTVSQHEAVALFVERATAVVATFSINDSNAQAVVAICHQVDGLPLAIELAAARARLFSPEVLLTRLRGRDAGNLVGSSLQTLTGGPRDLPTRQQTLRATIDWSYDLLNEAEQALFRRLAVFAGGCTIAAIEAICNSVSDLEPDVVDGLSSLVNGSLVRRGNETVPSRHGSYPEARFGMLETIREYAMERLELRGEADEIQRRHATYFTQVAERGSAEREVQIKLEWLDYLEAENGNLRAALQWIVQRREVKLGLRLAVALGQFWEMRDHIAEGRRWLEEILSIDDHVSPDRARALYEAGRLALMPFDLVAAEALTDQSIALYRRLDAVRGLVEALDQRSELAVRHSDVRRARLLGEEGLELARSLGDLLSTSRAQWRLAWIAAMEGDRVQAGTLAEESLEGYRRLGDSKGIGDALEILLHVARVEGHADEQRRRFFEECIVSLTQSDSYVDADRSLWLERNAFLARAAGEYQQAIILMESGIAASVKCRNRHAAAVHKVILALLLREQGRYDRSIDLLEASLTVFRGTEHLHFLGGALLGLSDVARDRGDSGRCISLAEETLKLCREIGDTPRSAFALHNIGVGAWQQGEFARAEAQLDAALAIMPFLEGQAEMLTTRGLVALDQGDGGRAGHMLTESLRLAEHGGWEQLGDVRLRWILPSAFEGLAGVMAGREEPENAMPYLAVANRMRMSMGTPIPPARAKAYRNLVTVLLDALGEERFVVAWAEGSAMKEEHAVRVALGEAGDL